MEEKDKVASNVKTDRPEKMSYEQLENIAHQLSEQVNSLYMKLQASNMTNTFKRLDYLFKVVEIGKFDDEFTQNCINEIKDLMTIPNNDKDNPEKE